MEFIKNLSKEEFNDIRSFIKNNNDINLISEFEKAPCYKAYYRNGNIKWELAPETSWFRTRDIWHVDAKKYSIYRYRNNIYILADFGYGLFDYYRWKFSEDFAKKIGLI